ncbi:peptide/nickel transport system ATP-binding protein [Rhizobium azibense]|nr:peptide/nickel transport system ATP-binding protein [Rhizobium azibense]
MLQIPMSTKRMPAKEPDRSAAPDLLIEVDNLHTHFFGNAGLVRAVDGVSFSIPRGRTVCVVGESGSGKSITGRSILNQVPRGGRVVSGAIRYRPDAGKPPVDIVALDPRGKEMRAIRGAQIALISQEPMAALSPVHTIGNQMIEVIRLHLNMGRREAKEHAIETLALVGIPRPTERMESYAFQFSGGMRQRVCIALALSCRPKLLIADEPTTALDVTTQANILDLLSTLQADFNLSVLFVTHDLGVVSEIADEVVVMYLGKVVETGDVDTIFHAPAHPYTRALLQSVPRMHAGGTKRLRTIEGMVPSPLDRPQGCGFHPRCAKAVAGLCDRKAPEPVTISKGHVASCLLHGETR